MSNFYSFDFFYNPAPSDFNFNYLNAGDSSLKANGLIILELFDILVVAPSSRCLNFLMGLSQFFFDLLVLLKSSLGISAILTLIPVKKTLFWKGEAVDAGEEPLEALKESDVFFFFLKESASLFSIPFSYAM